MPDAEMEARHIAKFEEIAAHLLQMRAQWEGRLLSHAGAAGMVAALDRQIAINEDLLCLAREAAANLRRPS